MAAPILLVADDLSTIASVKRVLVREGYEVVLATNAADAVIAYSHHLPGLVLVQPSVEGDRGNILLEELEAHPEARLLRVVLLGETVPGFAYQVLPLPIDTDTLATTVRETVRGGEDAEGWTVVEPNRQAAPHVPTVTDGEPETWRATGPSVPASARAEGGYLVVPNPSDSVDDPVEALSTAHDTVDDDTASEWAPATQPEATPEDPPVTPQETQALSDSLFGDIPSLEDELHRDVEAQALASVESSLQALPPDEELDQLEQEVREEAARRRAAREEKARASARVPAPSPGVEVDSSAGTGDDAETSFSSLEATPPEGTQRQSEAGGLVGEDDPFAGAEPSLPPDTEVPSATDARWTAPESVTPGDGPEAWPGSEADEAAAAAQDENASAEAAGDAESTWEVAPGEPQPWASEPSEAAAEAPANEDELAAAPPPDETAPDAEGWADAPAERAAAQEQSATPPVPEGWEEEGAEASAGADENVADDVAASPPAPQGWEDEPSDDTADVSAESADGAAEPPDAAPTPPALDEGADELAPMPTVPGVGGPPPSRAARPSLDAQPATPVDLAEGDAQLPAAVRAILERARRVAGQARDALLAEREAEAASALAQQRQVEHAEAMVRREREARSMLEESLDQVRDEAEASRTELVQAAAFQSELMQSLEQERARAETLAQEAAAKEALSRDTSVELEATREEYERTAEAAANTGLALDAARSETAALAARLVEAAQTLEAEKAAAAAAIAEKAARAETLARALEESSAQAAVRTEALEAARMESTARAEAAQAATAEAEAAQSRVEQLEASMELVEERARALEQKAIMPLSLPGKKALGVPRNDSVELSGLCRLMTQLVLAGADVRLELGAPGGTRTLWLRRGQVVAAESTFQHETLVDRARRDGLIDGRQEAELRLMRTAAPREQLEALKARSYIRDEEAVPLVQRFSEQVALEAFGEEATQYRLSEDALGPDTLVAAVPRPTLPMLAEAVRRVLPAGELLEQLGGGEAVPVPLESELDLRALGFSDKERKLLSWVDGEATVEDLSLASGIKHDLALKALLVAKLLGVIDVTAPTKAARSTSPDLDVKRLESKYDEVQEADYFVILGLPRSAGTEDVRRAFDRLAAEFDPLRYSGHPDAGLQQRAQAIHTLLEEAAFALDDEKRRSEYARHLLD